MANWTCTIIKFPNIRTRIEGPNYGLHFLLLALIVVHKWYNQIWYCSSLCQFPSFQSHSSKTRPITGSNFVFLKVSYSGDNWIRVVKGENEIQNLLDFCTEQEFRVIQIRKSLNEHTHNVTIGTIRNNLNKTKVGKSSNCHKMHYTHSAHSFKSSPAPSQFVHNKQCNRENSNLCKPFPLRKSLNSHGSFSSCSSKNFLQSSIRGSHEKSSFENLSYISLLERRRTANHADI